MNNAFQPAFLTQTPFPPQTQSMYPFVGPQRLSFDYGSPSSNMMPPPVLSNPNAEVLSYVQRAMEPVGSFKDDVTLITALREATQNGLNPNQALNSLHGQNDHTANAWREYYLDNKSRIDSAVSKSSKPLIVAGTTTVPHRRSPSPVHIKIEKKRKRRSASPSSPAGPSTSQRSTNNSLNASVDTINVKKLPKLSQHHTAPNTSSGWTIPKISDPPPSREPSPPTKVVSFNGRHKFTDEDMTYFFQYMTYALRKNPFLNRGAFSALLGAKAPHHSAASWGYKLTSVAGAGDYWDSLVSDVQKDMVGGDVAAEPLGSDTSQIDDDGASEYAAEQGGVSEDENLNNDRGGRLGQSRRLGAITDSEMQLLVKWAAEHPGWSSQTGSQRWIPFLEVNPSERSSQGWSKIYSLHKQEILSQAEELNKRGA